MTTTSKPPLPTPPLPIFPLELWAAILALVPSPHNIILASRSFYYSLWKHQANWSLYLRNRYGDGAHTLLKCPNLRRVLTPKVADALVRRRLQFTKYARQLAQHPNDSTHIFMLNNLVHTYNFFLFPDANLLDAVAGVLSNRDMNMVEWIAVMRSRNLHIPKIANSLQAYTTVKAVDKLRCIAINDDHSTTTPDLNPNTPKSVPTAQPRIKVAHMITHMDWFHTHGFLTLPNALFHPSTSPTVMSEIIEVRNEVYEFATGSTHNPFSTIKNPADWNGYVMAMVLLAAKAAFPSSATSVEEKECQQLLLITRMQYLVNRDAAFHAMLNDLEFLAGCFRKVLLVEKVAEYFARADKRLLRVEPAGTFLQLDEVFGEGVVWDVLRGKGGFGRVPKTGDVEGEVVRMGSGGGSGGGDVFDVENIGSDEEEDGESDEEDDGANERGRELDMQIPLEIFIARKENVNVKARIETLGWEHPVTVYFLDALLGGCKPSGDYSFYRPPYSVSYGVASRNRSSTYNEPPRRGLEGRKWQGVMGLWGEIHDFDVVWIFGNGVGVKPGWLRWVVWRVGDWEGRPTVGTVRSLGVVKGVLKGVERIVRGLVERGDKEGVKEWVEALKGVVVGLDGIQQTLTLKTREMKATPAVERHGRVQELYNILSEEDDEDGGEREVVPPKRTVPSVRFLEREYRRVAQCLRLVAKVGRRVVEWSG
ncbi:hypothetical protein HDV00_003653 [Rhizophlyctis rosea]|nr:hypothetical protein HDV00_003653 [Rhizophlyctis rosea]